MSSPQTNKVLVIDDDEMVLTIVRKLLEAELFSVDVSLSAREALTRLPETRYNAILCDMWMPGMTGKDFYHQVKKDFPEYQGRIIFLTGDIASEATWDFIEQKRLPYVLKPVNLPELRRKLQEVVGENAAAGPVKKGAEGRRHRRIAMKAMLRVRKKKWATGGPEIASVTNASKEGIYYLTERQYRIGTDVLVSFPFTGANDPEQEGVVVRVDERSENRRGVAIATGEAATAARATMTVSDDDRKRDQILSLADMTSGPARSGSVTEDVTDKADLKLQLARQRQESHKLADELSDLKSLYDRTTDERDRTAVEETGRTLHLRELASAKVALTQVVEDLKRKLEVVGKELDAAEAGREKAEAERDEATAALAAASAAPRRASAPPAPNPPPAAGPPASDAARLREQLADIQLRIQDLQAHGVGPLTILSAYCDMLAMNKSLDQSTRETIGEISQQATLLRTAFQKFLKR